jgi:hypothetical protein
MRPALPLQSRDGLLNGYSFRECPEFGFPFVAWMNENENDQQIRGEHANRR